MSDRLYIDVHILQTVPPSNLNRDDAGSPKQAIYGGARRARVSSQAWKRATRTQFRDMPEVDPSRLGTRTKRVSQLLTRRLAERTHLGEEAAARLSTALLAEQLKIKAGKKAEETAYLLFFGVAQLDAIIDLVADRAHELAALPDDALAKTVAELPVQAKLTAGHPIDVALFGRMVADIPALNVDAATQVAHALSVHPIEIEFDYYTAVDDEKPASEDAGAAMIGTVEYTSATLYRYATLNVFQLAENLGNDMAATVEATRAFLKAFVESMPTGHQNTFAHRTLPNLAVFTIRTDQPVNLVSAFETPIRNSSGIAGKAAIKLAKELDTVSRLWGFTPATVASTYESASLPADDRGTATAAFGDPLPLATAIDTITGEVNDRLSRVSSK